MISDRRLARFRQILERRQLDLEVVLDNIYDAHNASAVVRTSDGFGVGAVNLLYTEEVFPDISKGVSGHVRKWTTFHDHTDAATCVETLHARGLEVVATRVDPAASSHLEIDWTQPIALALGNEQRGCTAELIAAADRAIAIPMQGMAQSFNVSVAAAVVLGEAFRQRQAAGRYAASWSDEKEAILRAWLEREEPWEDPPAPK